MMSNFLQNEKGIIRTLPLLVIIAAVGIISFLLISSTVPFQNGLFSILNQKPKSHAATGDITLDMAYPCGLTNPAFCDNFSEPKSPGGRGGDLDDSKWNFSRYSQATNPNQGLLDQMFIGPVARCRSTVQAVAPNDTFFCGFEPANGPEPQHWMEAFNDNGNVVVNDGMIRQPFDFTSAPARPFGIINFGVDAKTDGSHTWWTEVQVTDQPVPGPHDGPSIVNHPRNGIRITFDGADSCLGHPIIPPVNNDTTGAGVNYIAHIFETINYQQNNLINDLGTGTGTCFVTKPDTSNMIQVQLSQTHADVYVSDAGSNVMHHAASININPPLPFSIGYVHFEHAQYNANKAAADGINAAASYQTYHWHDMGFDGPIHTLPRAYDMPDSLTGSVNVGYDVPSTGRTFTFNNVDTSNFASASLDFGVWTFGDPYAINYQVNGNTTHMLNFPLIAPGPPWWTVQHIDVPLAELKSGTNTVKFSTVASDTQSKVVANVGLTVNSTDVITQPPKVAMIPCSLMNLMMVVMPGMVMVNNPCNNIPSPQIIYDDMVGALKNSWVDCSQAYTHYQMGPMGSPLNGNFVFHTAYTIGNFVGLCNATGVDNSAYNAYDFWAMTQDTTGDPDGTVTIYTKEHPPVTIQLDPYIVDGAGYIPGGDTHLIPNKWEHVIIPFMPLGINNSTVTQLRFNYTGASQFIAHTVYLDGVSFTDGSSTNMPASSMSPMPSMSMMPTPSPSVSPGPSAAPSVGSSTTPTPSGCPKASIGDINCNGIVDLLDYSIVVSNFGKTVPAGTNGDINKNGIVDLLDYSTLVSNFGK